MPVSTALTWRYDWIDHPGGAVWRSYFTTHRGNQKKIIAVLDSNGDLYVAGRVITGQTNLQY
ncbi:DUF6342 family protein [Nocardia goodfellowii]